MLRIYALRPCARKPKKGLRKAANGWEHGDMGDNIFHLPDRDDFCGRIGRAKRSRVVLEG